MAAYFKRTLRIDWGWSDPAGIVLAPRFMDMFSENTVQFDSRASDRHGRNVVR